MFHLWDKRPRGPDASNEKTEEPHCRLSQKGTEAAAAPAPPHPAGPSPGGSAVPAVGAGGVRGAAAAAAAPPPPPPPSLPPAAPQGKAGSGFAACQSGGARRRETSCPRFSSFFKFLISFKNFNFILFLKEYIYYSLFVSFPAAGAAARDGAPRCPRSAGRRRASGVPERAVSRQQQVPGCYRAGTGRGPGEREGRKGRWRAGTWPSPAGEPRSQERVPTPLISEVLRKAKVIFWGMVLGCDCEGNLERGCSLRGMKLA